VIGIANARIFDNFSMQLIKCCQDFILCLKCHGLFRSLACLKSSFSHDGITQAQMDEASKVRKKLLGTFARYDAAAKRIGQIQTDSPTNLRVQNAIQQNAKMFLQQNMLPLQSLPRLLRIEKPDKDGPVPIDNPIVQEREKELKNQTIVLQEQQFLIESMITDAQKNRKFDTLEPLQQSKRDVQEEIWRLDSELASLH